MKTLSLILAALMLAGCAGMGTSGGTMGHSGTSSQWDSNQANDPNGLHRHANPDSIYFGG